MIAVTVKLKNSCRFQKTTLNLSRRKTVNVAVTWQLLNLLDIQLKSFTTTNETVGPIALVSGMIYKLTSAFCLSTANFSTLSALNWTIAKTIA